MIIGAVKYRVFLSVALLFSGVCARADDKHKLPPAKPAAQYAAHDTHEREKVTIAADPLDTKDKTSVFRVDYLKRGIMPVRMIVTNDSDKPIKLDQARIYFITADGTKLKAETQEQAERRMRALKDPSKSMEMPFPLRRSPALKSKDSDVAKDFDEADFADLTVAPHSTQSGVIFFDTSDYDQPLKAASLYVKEVQDADGKDLFPFEPKFPQPASPPDSGNRH